MCISRACGRCRARQRPGRAGADDGVELVDEKNDLAVAVGHPAPPVEHVVCHQRDRKACQEALVRLEKQCLEIHTLVQKPSKNIEAQNALLLEKITKAHDIFHEVEGLCHD